MAEDLAELRVVERLALADVVEPRASRASLPVPRPNPLQPLLLGVGALLLLLAAAGTFAFLGIRRRRRLAAIELELQQLLAEENARRDSPVTVSA